MHLGASANYIVETSKPLTGAKDKPGPGLHDEIEFVFSPETGDHENFQIRHISIYRHLLYESCPAITSPGSAT